MNTEPNESAQPEVETTLRKDEWNKPYGDVHSKGGLTKREYFAAKAMQGIIASHNKNMLVNDEWFHPEIVSKLSVQMADALIIELNK